MIALDTRAPLYMTPPCGSTAIESAMLAGKLGMITTPEQGNKLVTGALWCRDNGVFGGHYPGNEAYLAGLDQFADVADSCLFVVAPDKVGNHWATKDLATEPFSLPGESPDDARNMLERIREKGFPVAFVAQPGIEYDAWIPWGEFDVLFIGGGSDWKTSEAVAELVAAAHDFGVLVHMGRVNTAERYAKAAAMGCDSVDGTTLTFAPSKNVRRVLKWRADAIREAGAMLAREVEFPYVNGWNPDAVRPNRFAKRKPAEAEAVEVDEPQQFDLFAA
jgi:hypothetical protein